MKLGVNAKTTQASNMHDLTFSTFTCLFNVWFPQLSFWNVEIWNIGVMAKIFITLLIIVQIQLFSINRSFLHLKKWQRLHLQNTWTSCICEEKTYLVFGGLFRDRTAGWVGVGDSRWPQGEFGPLQIPLLHPRKLQQCPKNLGFHIFSVNLGVIIM